MGNYHQLLVWHCVFKWGVCVCVYVCGEGGGAC